MNQLIGLSLFLALMSCTKRSSAPEHPSALDFKTLQKTERILPAEAGYLLLEVRTNPDQPESTRQLQLYNHQGTFVDAIPLYGMVQGMKPDKILVNHTFLDEVARSRIGFLPITYFDQLRVSKGGGREGSFLVDSLRYHRATGSVTVYAKKPVHQFVMEARELVFMQPQFTEPVLLHQRLSELWFEPKTGFTFSMNRWENMRSETATTEFYCRDTLILQALFQQVINNHVARK